MAGAPVIQSPQDWRNFAHVDAREELRGAMAGLQLADVQPGCIYAGIYAYRNETWLTGDEPLLTTDANESGKLNFFHLIQHQLEHNAPFLLRDLWAAQDTGMFKCPWKGGEPSLKWIFTMAGVGSKSRGGWGFRFSPGTEIELGLAEGKSTEQLLAEGAQNIPAVFYPFSLEEDIPRDEYLANKYSSARMDQIAGPWLTEDLADFLWFLESCRDNGIIDTVFDRRTFTQTMTTYEWTTIYEYLSAVLRTTEQMQTILKTEAEQTFMPTMKDTVWTGTVLPTTKDTAHLETTQVDTVIGQVETTEFFATHSLKQTIVGYDYITVWWDTDEYDWTDWSDGSGNQWQELTKVGEHLTWSVKPLPSYEETTVPKLTWRLTDTDVYGQTDKLATTLLPTLDETILFTTAQTTGETLKSADTMVFDRMSTGYKQTWKLEVAEDWRETSGTFTTWVPTYSMSSTRTLLSVITEVATQPETFPPTAEPEEAGSEILLV
ncbi:hypothetical protein PDESU_03304 [Pontiella desulfatans]|uniref:Uncharacterized protein n=1 Tax=Pontiella desulfatans TaxID=2750659 RepID=A0A6C2U4A7_PONDE|nr:hypothetical protein [Pontiella desulfatans]VGO14735.1 hypothetical protein PDESU_03304 [Pontiella desulfatans]